MRFLLTMLICFSAIAGAVSADEVRPGYLELKTTDGKAYTVKWKVPMKGDSVLSITPQLPESCGERTPLSRSAVGSAMISHWSVVCPTGLAGERIAIDGLDNTSTDVLVRIESRNGATQMVRLKPGESGFNVMAESSAIDIIRIYTGLGVEHILLGVDHLLFVFALLLIVKGWRRLIGTITAFTLAHSITLAAATLGYFYVPQAPVEAVIALSILFLATEIAHGQRGKAGLAERSPWLVAFVFGLLHGFGFAGALAEIGLPEHSIPLALLFFNIGVELGQLIFVTVILGAGWGLRRLVLEKSLRWGELSISYAIGGIAAFWLLERTYSFWA